MHDMYSIHYEIYKISYLCFMKNEFFKKWSFFRRKMDGLHNTNLYKRWDFETKFKIVKTFGINVLKLPIEFWDNENVIKLVTLIFPWTIR